MHRLIWFWDGFLCLQLPDIADGVFDTELYGNIKFAEMTMYVSLLDLDLAMRRLTTKSYVSTEVDSCYLAAVDMAASPDDTRRSCKTKWVWYWESPDGTWNRYKVRQNRHICRQCLRNAFHIVHLYLYLHRSS